MVAGANLYFSAQSEEKFSREHKTNALGAHRTKTFPYATGIAIYIIYIYSYIIIRLCVNNDDNVIFMNNS